MRVPRRVLPLLVLAASLQALWPVARGGAQTTEADVHVAQAIIAIDERRYDAALAELKRALEIEPDHVEALYYTGVVYAAQRRPDLAVPFLEKARAKAPADPAVGFQLGLAYFARQQYDRAQPLLEAVFKTNPSSTASATTSASCAIALRTTGARWPRSAPAARAIRRSSSSRAFTRVSPSPSSASPRRRRPRSSRPCAWRRAQR